MSPVDLECVLAWRNHPEVRRYMYTRHEITLEEHAGWFERASKDPGRHLLIFEDGEVPLGFINLQQIAPGGIAEWGFYAAPDAPKGTGRQLGRVALRYAFDEVGFHKLCGQALAFNERSIRFHRSMGFREEGVLRQQHFDGQHHHDVVCFGLLAGEWQPSD
ncbi:UDP-4-amino-4,6-dideoxy-N-acetyl-beta-L-altrosamine N-acetyltransferase [Stutzerimonas balearica]|uniref:UDP-4-amino-4, 6-dideoxy-N-acetyl-beta-L-altrosamine N-acetyltransferase n=1 Tax=Stutzerimonas balearica TaxID=74829 RepID=UPI003F769B5D